MSKEKVTCCDHEEEIASLKRSKAKLMEVNSMQEEALKEYFPLSKDRVCCNHGGDIAKMESDKRLLMKMNSLQEEALMEHFRVNKAKEVQVLDITHPHPEHEDEVNQLKDKIDRLQIQAKYLEGVIEAKYGANEGSCNEGGVATKPKRKRSRRTKKKKNKENMEINHEGGDPNSRRGGVPDSTTKGFAGSNNPSHVLFVDYYGHIRARFIGPQEDNDYASGGAKWVVDSGATSHMIGSKEIVVDLEPSHSTVSYGDNTLSLPNRRYLRGGNPEKNLGHRAECTRDGGFWTRVTPSARRRSDHGMRSTNLVPSAYKYPPSTLTSHSPPFLTSLRSAARELLLAVPNPPENSPEHHRSDFTTVVFIVFLTPANHRMKTSSPATPTTAEPITMSSATPPPTTEPIFATPLSSAPPPFVPVQLDPTKDSGKDTEGTSAIPEKTSEAGQAKKKAEEIAAKKSKDRQRDSESKGKWWPCTTIETELKNLEEEGFLQPGSWRTVPNALAPAPQDNEMVLTKALVERGFSFPPSDFFLEILKVYGLQPHNISPNSVLAISNHVTLCEGHLRVTPELSLFQYYFTVKKERIRQSTELATCGSITFMIRPGRVYPIQTATNPRGAERGFLHEGRLRPGEHKEIAAFQELPRHRDSGMVALPPPLRIAPAHTRRRDDSMRSTKDNISADAIDKRIRLLIKIPRELHVHVCNKDIHMNGSGTTLEALEESELGTLVRVPTTGTTDPEAASEAEAHDAPRPSKRKRPAPSSPAAKRAREVLSIAATRKAEVEKKRLKLIDTSNKGQPDIQQFFKPSGSGSQPPKAPRILKKKVKPSPASVPVTPEVEIPPKASSASKPDPKDVINLNDLPEDPIGHGDSGKGASSSAPPPDQPSATFAGPTEEEYEQKVQLIHTSGTLQANPQPAPSLQKRSLAERHAEVSAMLDKVWGKPNVEMQELTELEDGLKVFFAKHKEVRQTTRKLHEDLRIHVLEQITEIEALRQNAENSQKAIQLLETRLQEETAKHSAFDDLSAKVKVLEAENESLKAFIKESSGKENEARKELSEKHARDMAELNDKLKKSQSRVTSLVAKNKVQEAEAEAIDKLIFPSLGFEWTKESNLKRTEAYDEAWISIDSLFAACRGIAKSLSLKRAKTSVIDTMTKLMEQVPEFIKDWQESSARGVASLVLATCKAHFPSLSFANVAHGTPEGSDMGAILSETKGYEQLFVRRVNHSFWYHKYDLPKGFSDAEEEEGEPEYYAEGSGSSIERSGEGSDDDSEAGSGDSDGDGSAYQESEEEDSE
ncbi:hypothetical protein QYE76_012944 [Lolium multiflorum]|uniref:Transposase (putative) gypsy type domain-containing protein n=1 Tax=Lolium multiflorum TaxID=4521 RepID=A0AAD8U065_LOLMU|nr:hypothetical protein QYE76_012944 [Lolium multiflorum]